MPSPHKEEEASSDRNGDPKAFGSILVSEGETVAAAAEPTATSAAKTELSIEELYAEQLLYLDLLFPLLGPQRTSSRRNYPPPRPTMQWPPDLEHSDKPALGEGLKVAHFKDDADWAASFKFSVGSLTTSITFAACFKITTYAAPSSFRLAQNTTLPGLLSA